jgi:hypothetical protein
MSKRMKTHGLSGDHQGAARPYAHCGEWALAAASMTPAAPP